MGKLVLIISLLGMGSIALGDNFAYKLQNIPCAVETTARGGVPQMYTGVNLEAVCRSTKKKGSCFLKDGQNNVSTFDFTIKYFTNNYGQREIAFSGNGSAVVFNEVSNIAIYARKYVVSGHTIKLYCKGKYKNITSREVTRYIQNK